VLYETYDVLSPGPESVWFWGGSSANLIFLLYEIVNVYIRRILVRIG
jgi:hypothetical protein